MAYSGTYKVKNIRKYEGNHMNVKYRSLWERNVFRWLDNNDDILGWSSEEVVVGYRCKTDNKIHRYFVDLFIRTKNGCYLVEIKPNAQTKPPKRPARQTQKYLKEVMTYAKNISKWEAATEFANKRGMIFQVWDENTIKGLGIKIIT